jgi:Na+-transporting NADH:ubiquinone oxidoreductase subunit A
MYFCTQHSKGSLLMSQDIRIKKGLDLNLVGVAEQTFHKEVSSATFGFYLEDFHGVTPKLHLKEGAEIKAGEPLFYDKNAPEIQFVSPVSGEVVAIERGARRKVLSIKLLADKEQEYIKHKKLAVSEASREVLVKYFLATGLWPFIKQRPFDLIADPSKTPKAIFISGLNTGPLNPDLDFVLKGSEDKLQAALSALKKLTPGSVHVTVASKKNSVFSSLENIELHEINQLHPAGLVGTQIAHIDPINKGEVVWVVAAQDLVIIGELLLTGQFNASRAIAVTGSRVKAPQYIRTKIGAELRPILEAIGLAEGENRLIAGDVLTGMKVELDEHLRFYANQLTVIAEGNDYEFFGWNKPVFNKVSPTRALTFSWLNKKKAYDLDTNTNGEHRAFVVTGSYEEVFPLDIYPMQLLKACMVKDLDEMEQLGLYEVAPEDFSLTEFICISKQAHQAIIREGLDVLKQELG